MARILIIEDEAAILKLLGRIVRHLGHEPIAAGNGPTALALAEVEPDMIITDLFMPGKPSGMELVHALRQRWPTVPMGVISGYVSNELVGNWDDHGVDAFLAKPFDMHEIQGIIDRMLNHPRRPKAC